jgi:hypothetical protein
VTAARLCHTPTDHIPIRWWTLLNDNVVSGMMRGYFVSVRVNASRRPVISDWAPASRDRCDPYNNDMIRYEHDAEPCDQKWVVTALADDSLRIIINVDSNSPN